MAVGEIEAEIRKVILHVGHAQGSYLASVVMEIGFGPSLIQIRGMRLIQLAGGKVILAMPSRKDARGQHQDIVRPMSDALQRVMERAAISEYDRLIARGEYQRG